MAIHPASEVGSVVAVAVRLRSARTVEFVPLLPFTVWLPYIAVPLLVIALPLALIIVPLKLMLQYIACISP